jgi:hypothetical protein
MSIRYEGREILVDGTVEGSVFPRGEAEIAFTVLVDSTRKGQPLRVKGSIYGTSLVVRGQAAIDGPAVSRGDARLEPVGGAVRLYSGIVVNGSLSAIPDSGSAGHGLAGDVSRAGVIIKGDVVASQNVSLRNSVVFGSIRALNIRLDNCVVLGTTVAIEQLVVSMSTIAGYLARDVTFEGACSLIYAIGESTARPTFVPHEGPDGTLTAPDVRFYPSVREKSGVLNSSAANPDAYSSDSKLDFDSDWVRVNAQRNIVTEGEAEGLMTKWVLSLGGRIGDLGQLASSVDALTSMLRCGFEFEHYQEKIRKSRLEETMKALTAEERWILAEVCR